MLCHSIRLLLEYIAGFSSYCRCKLAQHGRWWCFVSGFTMLTPCSVEIVSVFTYEGSHNLVQWFCSNLEEEVEGMLQLGSFAMKCKSCNHVYCTKKLIESFCAKLILYFNVICHAFQ